MSRALSTLACAGLAACVPACGDGEPPLPPALTSGELAAIGDSTLDLEDRPGRLSTQEGAEEARAIVLVFVDRECPISNRYAPTLTALADEFGGRGVELVLVYVGADTGVESLLRHRAEYGLDLRALRDPGRELVALCGVTVTPEAALWAREAGAETWQIVYRGRIDDTWEDLTHKRPRPGRRDLAEALDELLSGGPITVPRTRAVGCLIERRAE